MDALPIAILDDDRGEVKKLLRANPSLATSPFSQAKLYQSKIFHWIYVGDTPLHLAAAGYRVEIIEQLLAARADPNAAHNHRRSGPLHYAADGDPTRETSKQVETLNRLLKAGAKINAQDKNGASPLH